MPGSSVVDPITATQTLVQWTDMQLKNLNLQNFRSFTDERVSFDPRLTVLVGENNGGKSNIIDAIRLISTPLGGRRELYCEHTDIRFDSSPNRFEVTAIFNGLSPPQQGRLLSATTDDTLTKAQFGLTYDASGNQTHVRPTLWAGRFKSPPEPGAHEMIRHVYLPPLRDAKRALASGNPTRIHALLNHFLGGRDPADIAKMLARASNDPILTDVDAAVAAGLDVLTAGVRPQNAELGFNTEEKLIDIARDLRFKLADHGITPEDLQYSGHGFANLLYIATIAVELEKTESADLTLFLVEEPEAHLHPQLQAAVLNYLQERAEHSVQMNQGANAPAGHLQVIVATHSPNLSAWVPSSNVVFVRSVEPSTTTNPKAQQSPSITSPHTQLHATSKPQRVESRTIPLAKLNLSEAERRKIDRYLDVTKSALLFGGRVLLVEGIAEALLLPVIAKHYVLQNKLPELRVFRSAVFVPIDGVDFVPYTKALLTPYNNVRIADRLVIVTDGDKQTVESGEPLPGAIRKSKLDSLASTHHGASILDVIVSTYSLEAELVASGNADAMKDVYLTLHPRSETKWDAAVAKTGDEQARGIQELFQSTPKGDFAHLLAEIIATSNSFRIPDYIRQAIDAVVK